MKTFTQKQKIIGAIIGLVVIICIVSVFIFCAHNKRERDRAATSESVFIDSSDVTDATPVTSVRSNESKPVVPMTYREALVAYKDARIQLDGACNATPFTSTYKNGTSVMIDNRSSVDRTVFLGKKFVVKAYGFAIVKLSSDTLPKTLLLDCDGQQNSATVLIQK